MLNVPAKVKDALRSGMYHKNYRFVVMQEDGVTEDFTIDNNNLVAESVAFDERMCSSEYLKFGLCEGTSLEFEYFGFASIYGRRIQAFCDVEYKDNGTLASYTIPMGWYDVDKCPRQVSTGKRKVTAYNKLKSNYIDGVATSRIKDLFVDKTQNVRMYDIKRLMLKDYSIETANETEWEYTSDIRVYEIDDATATKMSGTSLNRVGDYGVLLPTDAWNMGVVNKTDKNVTFKYYFETGEDNITLDPTKVYRFDSKCDLDALEQIFYDYIKNLMAQYETVFTSFSRATYMSNLVKNAKYQIPSGTTVGGWGKICCIVLTKQDNTTEKYSLVMKDNGVSVIGGMGDLSKKLFTGYTSMKVYMPRIMGIYSGSSTSSSPLRTLALTGFCGSDDVYDYYDREDGNLVIKQNTNPVPRYPDGSRIEAGYWRNLIKVYEVSNLTNADMVQIPLENLSDVSLRDISAAIYETECKFGRLDRETDKFIGIELNQALPTPQEAITPLDSAYTIQAGEDAFKSMYNKLWMDEGGTQSFKYLIITYKGLDGSGNGKDYTLQRTINEHGTQNYNMSDNWMFRNLVWTSAQVAEFADAMVEKMRGITWFPFEMWCAGLPYVETGDEIEIIANGEAHTSYVLQRTLKGIQNLEDTFINGKVDVF